MKIAHADYSDELNELSSSMHLADDSYWYSLLHYRTNKFFGGVASEIDDPNFFNAADGKTNPQHELTATIEGFFAAPEAGNENSHPQCKFPARLDWLAEKLKIDRQRLPKVNCEKFGEWFSLLSPNRLTLVFPEAFMNNPASMFGHTLLRIDDATDESRSGLLGYGANYSAQTQGELAFIYAFKGVFGLYEGHFSVQPYYQQVKKYSDFESRDIWEYQLALKPSEVERAVKHLWELHEARIDYFYFSENCSYMLLSLLEVAQPGLSISPQFRRWGWAIPVDTVRAVAESEGLVSKVIFRPSQGSILRYHASLLSRENQDLAKELTDPNFSLTPARPEVLELSYDYLMYRLSYGKVEDVPEIRSRAFALLSERSKFPPSNPINPPTPTIRPEEGHRTKRISVGFGEKSEQLVYEVEFRPAFHDVLDPPGGYAEGAQISFFDLKFWQQEGNQLRLERFSPIEITSISPRGYLLKPISWKIATEISDARIDSDSYHHFYRVRGGPGLTYKLFDKLLAVGFMETTAEYGEALEDSYSLGAGPSLSFIMNNSQNWGGQLNVKFQRHGFREEDSEAEVKGEVRWSLNSNLSLRASHAQEWRFDDHWTESIITLASYF